MRSSAAIVLLLAVPLTRAALALPANDRLALHVDTGEAEAALAILDAENAGQTVTDVLWSRLVSSPGYVRLHEREAAMGVPFTDEAFRAFLAAPETRARAAELRRTLAAWSAARPEAAAERAFAYLPAGARIAATVYPVVKPRPNSFVFDVAKNAALFLYLNPDVSAAKFENTLAHELHHIGFSTACPPAEVERRWQDRPAPLRALHKWLGAYGEGFAMLAAAGGPDVHPHATSDAATRARWDRDVGNVDRDLGLQQDFFLQIVRGQVTANDAIDTRMSSFFGEQGPWYTVGWRMAATIERAFGRERLIAAECDGDALLASYNAAVARLVPGASGPWSTELLYSLDANHDPASRPVARPPARERKLRRLNR